MDRLSYTSAPKSPKPFEENDQRIIYLWQEICSAALNARASDIHVEALKESCCVRLRVDGDLIRYQNYQKDEHIRLIARIKILAKLDIAEQRVPQDGRLQISLNPSSPIIDCRVSTIPTLFGEKVVIRLLNTSAHELNIDHIGFTDLQGQIVYRALNQTHGLILVCGPTGSGKTTTLYATLEKISNEKQKIITVEDPVEYQLDGITQIQANASIGLGFAEGLRSIVRQDPDILMIGEIRDHETAEIAIESALTGHLVFSTLHTNDAAGAVTRLQDMGVEGYLISSSLLAIQAQRLVRRVCTECAETHPLSLDEARVLDIDSAECAEIRRGKGCERCGQTGYRGRVGLYELLLMSDEIRHQIASGADANSIRDTAIKGGMRTLRQDALEKLRAGLTTPEEVVRVTRAV